jgi:hypothetical protein
MKSTESFRHIFFLHFEWMALTAGLLLMALLDPFAGQASLCLIERAGFSYCPGEGLGRSMALAFRGEFSASFQLHPAGIAAIFILTGRILSIFYRNYKLNIKL